jgi:methyl-accepting chemotaxis protein
MSNARQGDRRGKIWISSFQTWLGLRILLYCVLYQFALAMALRLGEHYFAIAGEASAPAGVERFVLGLLFAAIVFLAMVTLDAVRFTHRLVGPMYRFRKTVQLIAQGDPVPYVRLRKDDFLGDFRDDFNRMLKALEEKGLVVIDGTSSQAKPPSCEVGKPA